MKILGHILPRSHIGYSKLVSKSDSVLKNKKCQSFLTVLGHYFCLTTSYAPIALLPVTLLYLNNKLSIIPSFVCISVIIVLFFGILYQCQDMLLYHPCVPEDARLYVATPPFVPLEEVNFMTADNVKLHGYLLKQKDSEYKDAPTIVQFHGNAGNIGSPSVMPLYLRCSANVFVIDYRGFGKSAGIPSEEGLYRDGEAAVRYLHSRSDINLDKIILYGHSLGGAVAIHIASKCQWVKGRICAVIVENTFASIPSTAAQMFKSVIPFIGILPKLCFKNRFESILKVSHIQVPILFIYGDSDEIVCPSMAKALHGAAGNPRSAIVEIPNGTHNNTWCVSPLYVQSIRAFLMLVLNKPEGHAWTVPENSSERLSLSYQWQAYCTGKHDGQFSSI